MSAAKIEALWKESLQLFVNIDLVSTHNTLYKALQILEVEGISKPISKQQEQVIDFSDANVEELMWKTLALFAKNKVQAFPYAGTLLGLTRDNKLLPNDKDIDVGVFINQIDLASTVLQNSGWEPVANAGLPFFNYKAFYHTELGITIDLCGLAMESTTNMLIGGFWLKDAPSSFQRILEYPGEHKFNLVDSPYGKVWQLENPESWLELFYGPEWRVPDPHFYSIISSRNLRNYSLLVECFGLMRLLEYWIFCNYKKALEIAKQIQYQQPNNKIIGRIIQKLELLQ